MQTTQQDKTHHVWHPSKNYQAHIENPQTTPSRHRCYNKAAEDIETVTIGPAEWRHG